ncbi:MAG: phosphate signaling complex protein PhoU [Fibrobacteria bacterium]|nr:phosphate signaling complex protein PhoU [Fibrobacteria bacterium]
MSNHLLRDIQHLEKRMLYFCTLVEENLTRAVESLEKHDEEKAMMVIAQEKQIDNLEIEIEEECLKILALHQPVAKDLRYIVAVLKINNDLERIGDMAAHIGERFLSLGYCLEKSYFNKLTQCARDVRRILHNCLDALIGLDKELAQQILLWDTDIDTFHEEFFNEIQQEIKENPQDVHVLLNLLSISKQLERISDHATNIAEDVIYLVDGEIVRHSG